MALSKFQKSAKVKAMSLRSCLEIAAGIWLLALVLFAASAAFSAPLSNETSQLPACTEAWAGLDSQYDYSRDTRQTELGNEGYSEFASKLDRKNCRKPWTVLLYVAADNNLTPYAFMDLYEMEAGFQDGQIKSGSTPRSDLIVQLDTNQTRKVRRLHMFQTPEAYNEDIMQSDFTNTQERDVRSPIVMSFDETSVSTPKADLEAFLRWGVREYPADHYMVVVWGHGQGWTALPRLAADKDSPFAGFGFGGLAFDDSDQNFLSTPDLNEVLGSVSAHELGGKPVDVYVSDACLMQMFEVAFEVSKNARFVVGSTAIQNFLGLPYRSVMSELNSGLLGETSAPIDGDEALHVAKMLPKLFRESMLPEGLQGKMNPQGIESITMSSINSDEMRMQLAPRLLQLSQALKDYIVEDADVRSIDVQFALQEVPAFQGGAQDLGGFLTLISNVVSSEWREKGELSPAAQKLQKVLGATQNALRSSVNAFALGTQYSESDLYLLGMKGLSMWLPSSQEEYDARVEDFEKSSFFQGQAGGQKWISWLQEIYYTNQMVN